LRFPLTIAITGLSNVVVENNKKKWKRRIVVAYYGTKEKCREERRTSKAMKDRETRSGISDSERHLS